MNDGSIQSLQAVINALVHRDYTDAGNIQVRLFDNRLEIWSPGLLPKEIKVDKLLTESRSIPRNRKLAFLFYHHRLIENWGTGFIRMDAHCKLNGNPQPLFEEKSGAFVITFLKQALNEGINEGINRLISLIHEMPGYRGSYLAKKMNIPYKTLERWVAILKEQGKIEYRGSKKTGGYFSLIPHSGR